MSRRPRVDWSDWSLGPGRHPVQGAVHAGAVAFGATALGDLMDIPAGWPLVAGLGLGLVASAYAGWRQMVREVIAYRSACCVGAGAWSSAVLAWSSPWTWQAPASLAALMLTAGAFGTVLARSEATANNSLGRGKDNPKSGTLEASSAALPQEPEAALWQARLRQITRRPVQVVRLERWEPATGFTLIVLLPADGTTMMDIKTFETPLAAAANLPIGCNVEVLRYGQGRRLIQIRVATENALSETRHMGSGPKGELLPGDLTPLSIEDPLLIGDHADRSPATINLRFACCVLVGQTDSGKSNTLNVITHQLVRCTNAVAWAIDLSGSGRFPRPWVRAWAEGRAPVPVIDWAAITPDDAIAMCDAAIQIVNGRTAAYQDLMFRANDDKLPVSPEVPQIVIVVDEFADLPDTVKAKLETISNTGRGAGVRVVSSVLRAIGADISRAMIVQARERIALRVSDEAELQYLFDSVWSRGRFDPASMPYQGSGMVSTGAAVPEPFKSRRLEPIRIDAAAVAVAAMRPGLDDVSVHLAGPAYAGRWARTLPLMFPEPGASPKALPSAVASANGGTTATLAAPASSKEETVDTDDTAGSLAASMRNLEAAARRAKEAREAADREVAGPEQLPKPDYSVVEGWLADGDEQRGDRPDPKMRMRQIVQENRRGGIGPRAVWQQLQAEGYPTSEPTVIGWMRADVGAGYLTQSGDKQPYHPGPKLRQEMQR